MGFNKTSHQITMAAEAVSEIEVQVTRLKLTRPKLNLRHLQIVLVLAFWTAMPPSFSHEDDVESNAYREMPLQLNNGKGSGSGNSSGTVGSTI
jgi:hypothetical protein